MNIDYKVWEILINKPVLAAVAAQLSSQIIKIFLPVLQGKPPDFRKIADYGGKPSAHTAFIIAVTVAVGLTDGWKSPLFALSGVVASILIYDILKMRKAVEVSLKMGEKALEFNHLTIADKPPQFKGHTLSEVIMGAIWGTFWAILICVFVKF